LKGVLLHLIQRRAAWAGCGPLQCRTRGTKHRPNKRALHNSPRYYTSTASVPTSCYSVF